MALASLDLELEVFQGPFDLLLTLVLKEEVDLLEVDLAEIVLSYIDHLERSGELDLETTTEFLVLIAALLELKSRLMLPQEDEEGLDMPLYSPVEVLASRDFSTFVPDEMQEIARAIMVVARRLATRESRRYRSAG